MEGRRKLNWRTKMKISIKSAAAFVSVFFILAAFLVYEAPAANSPAKAVTFEIVTHLIVGTNSEGPRIMPSKGPASSLARAKGDFDYKSYIPVTRYYQLVGDGGNMSTQTMTRRLGSIEEPDNPIFTELSYGGFKIDESDPGWIEFRSFNFQARLPLRFKGIDKNPQNVSLVNYETIKISLVNVRLEIPAGPKLIATLPLPDNDETLFFVLEVRKSGAV